MIKHRHILPIAGLLLILILIVGSIVIWNRIGNNNLRIIREGISERNWSYLSTRYVSTSPNIDGRPVYGNPNAPIALILYSDLESDAARHFIKEIMPSLEEEYVKTNRVRFIHKNYITEEDIKSKGEIYQRLMALSCIGKLSPESYYDAYFEMWNISELQELTILADRYGLSETDFSSCLNGPIGDDIAEDFFEIDKLGMVGVKPRIYLGYAPMDLKIIDGIPSYTRIARIIKDYQTGIGD